MGITKARTEHDVADLIAGLISQTRREPWCVVTTQEFGDVPFSVDDIFEQSKGLCEIWVVPNGPLTYLLAAELPADCEVYGGAARTYPPGTSWMSNPVEAKRRFWHTDSRMQAQQLENVISDIHSMAYEAGLFTKRLTQQHQTTATVKSFFAEGARAVVMLPNGTLATIAQELTVKEIPLDRILDIGQVVNGSYDKDLGRYLLDISSYSAKDFLTHFPHGSITLGLVRESERTSGKITLFPGLDVTIKKTDISSNPKDRVDLFFEPGDVVAVRVIRDAQGKLALRTFDIDDDEEIMDALPLVEGGKPWLREEDDYLGVEEKLDVEPVESFLERFGLSRLGDEIDAAFAPQDDTTDLNGASPTLSPIIPGPGLRRVVTPETGAIPSVSGKSLIESLQLRIAQLQSENAALKSGNLATAGAQLASMRQDQARILANLVAERDTAIRSAESHKTRASDLRKQLQEARRNQVVGLDFGANRENFANTPAGARQWLDFELNLAWIERVSPSEREQNPLPVFDVGPRFIDSFAKLSNGKKNKALRAMLDVLSFDATRLHAREVHPLRESDGAASPDLVRDDGAKCMRAYIEEKSPSARRLHYWLLPQNRIEFSRVVVHDDMEP